MPSTITDFEDQFKCLPVVIAVVTVTIISYNKLYTKPDSESI